MCAIHFKLSAICSMCFGHSNRKWLGLYLHLSRSLIDRLSFLPSLPPSLPPSLLQCIWKITRQLPQLLPSIHVDQLLREVHLFFQGYTQIVPSPTPDDTPYRTVKTILFHLTNTIGSEVSI